MLVSGDADDVVGDQIIVTVVDDDGTEAAAEAPEEVLIDDVSPTLDVTKTASSESVDEPGDEVEFTVTCATRRPSPSRSSV